MKIPKIKKLPSGSYFCRIRTGGRDHAITGQSYDQVYAEAVAYKAGIIKAKRQPERVTLKLAAASPYRLAPLLYKLPSLLS